MEEKTENGAVAVPVPEEVPAPAAPAKTYPAKVSEVDLMRVENAFLKIQNLRLQRDTLQRDLIAAQQQEQQLQQAVLKLRAEFQERYDVDIANEKNRVQADGTILPRQPQN